jgi:hypothetical protein
MPQNLGDHLDRHSLRQQERRSRVAQVVDANAGQRGLTQYPRNVAGCNKAH